MNTVAMETSKFLRQIEEANLIDSFVEYLQRTTHPVDKSTRYLEFDKYLDTKYDLSKAGEIFSQEGIIASDVLFQMCKDVYEEEFEYWITNNQDDFIEFDSEYYDMREVYQTAKEFVQDYYPLILIQSLESKIANNFHTFSDNHDILKAVNSDIAALKDIIYKKISKES